MSDGDSSEQTDGNGVDEMVAHGPEPQLKPDSPLSIQVTCYCPTVKFCRPLLSSSLTYSFQGRSFNLTFVSLRMTESTNFANYIWFFEFFFNVFRLSSIFRVENNCNFVTFGFRISIISRYWKIYKFSMNRTLTLKAALRCL